MKSDFQVLVMVDIVFLVVLNKVVEVILVKVYWYQGEEKVVGEKINVSFDQVEFLCCEGVIKKEV